MPDDFDPRHAALFHAGEAESLAPGPSNIGQAARENATGERVLAQVGTALVCGLIYVGDRLEEIRRELWNANHRERARTGR